MSREKHPRSRWIKDGPVPRYDERTLDGIVARYREQPEWRNGARVSVRQDGARITKRKP